MSFQNCYGKFSSEVIASRKVSISQLFPSDWIALYVNYSSNIILNFVSMIRIIISDHTTPYFILEKLINVLENIIVLDLGK